MLRKKVKLIRRSNQLTLRVKNIIINIKGAGYNV